MSTQYNILKNSSLGVIDFPEKVTHIKTQFQNATCLSELNDIINEINDTTNNIDKTLNHKIINDSRKLQSEISNIELNRARLSNVTNISSQLSQLFSSANDVSHTLTYKIKTLDLEIHKVNTTLKFVQDIQKLKNMINKAFYALEHNDNITAAQCINTIYSEISPDLIKGEYASVAIPSTDIPELPDVILEKWQEQLCKEFVLCFEDASKTRNLANITKYFQLFPLINCEETGLRCYSKFICSVIADTSRNLINTLNKAGDSQVGIYSTVTSQFFESISMMLSQHGPMIKKYYGKTYPQALRFVISEIQSEIDSQIGLLGDTFYDMRRIDKLLLDIKLYQFPLLERRFQEFNKDSSIIITDDSQEDTELVSVVTVGDLMEEFTSIFHYWGLYCKFITDKYLAESQDEIISEPLKIPQVIESSQFSTKIRQKYSPAYEKMFLYYFRRSLEKAISIEEIPNLETFLHISAMSLNSDQPPCSSVIEDVTLVLNTTLRSTIDTTQLNIVKHFISESYKIVLNDLIAGYFMKGLKDNQPRYNSILSLISNNNEMGATTPSQNSRSGTPGPEPVSVGGIGFLKGAASSALGSVVGSGVQSVVSTSQQNTKFYHFIILLNSIAMGQDYFNKICQNVQGDHLGIRFPFSNDKQMIESIINESFILPFNNTTNKIIQENIIVLYNQAIKSSLARLVNEFLPDSSVYTLYSSSSLNDTTTMHKLSTNWATLIQPYKQTLHKKNLTKLLRLVIVNLTNLIEKKLFQVLEKYKTNELGALKLEKDLSFFINEVCNDNYELREKFIRVTQIVLLLGMDDDEYEISLKTSKLTIEVDKSENGEQARNNLEDPEDEEFLGINWVLTPLERRKIRSFRI